MKDKNGNHTRTLVHVTVDGKKMIVPAIPKIASDDTKLKEYIQRWFSGQWRKDAEEAHAKQMEMLNKIASKLR